MVVEVTKEDLDRIHSRLDDIQGEQKVSAVNQERTATILLGLKESLDSQNRDRALTCPSRFDINKNLAVSYAIGGKADPVGGAQDLVNRVNTMWGVGKWAGGILMVAAIVPSAIWLFGWLGKLIAGAVAGGM